MRNSLRLLALLLILGAIGAEFLASSSQGLGPLQWIGIVIGLGLFVLSWLSWDFGNKFLIILASLIFSILAIEFLLGFTAYQADYDADLLQAAQSEHERLPYWLCEPTLGCRFSAEQVPADLCSNPTTTLERICLINPQGFADTDSFVESEALAQADYKILVLGDSFTYGASADIGQSYIELTEAALQAEQNVLIWNLAIPGTSTRQALALAEAYVPIMQPDLVLLGMFGNDFVENLYPLDLYERWTLADGSAPFVYAYQLNRTLEPERLSNENIYFRSQGKPTSANGLERWLHQTRLGSLLVNAYASLLESGQAEAQNQRSIELTVQFLGDLQGLSQAQGALFLVVQIEGAKNFDEVTSESQAYEQVQSLLDYARLETLPYLEKSDYNPLPDGHWNNAGHQKISQILISCIQEIIEQAAICSLAQQSERNGDE